MTISIDKIIDSKIYLWTIKKHSNPKTRKYWLDVKEGIVVLNPEKIAEQLDFAANKIAEFKKAGKEILILCEKTVYRNELEKLSTTKWIHCMSYKVPWGVLTNFDTLLSRIQSMNQLKNYIQTEEFARLTKKERLVKERQLSKLEIVYKWVTGLRKKPDLVIVVDWMHMMKFVKEVEKTKIDSIVLANSNFNKWWDETKLVMCNTNAYESLDFVLQYILK